MTSKNGRRDLAKEWLCRKTIQRHRESDLPVRKFCETEGLKD